MRKVAKERPGSWVKIRGNVITCERCGRKHILDLPLVIKVAVQIMKAYAEQHKFCEEKA